MRRRLPALALVGIVAPVTVVVLFAHNGAPGASGAFQAGSPVAHLIEHSERVGGAPPTRARAFPSAAEFAHAFVGAANQYAEVTGHPARINQPDCVQAAPGRYMCSYAVVKPGTAKECHLIQARWTPHEASTITVTLAGRTTRCRSLREAISSLH